jgi:ribosomal protein L4
MLKAAGLNGVKLLVIVPDSFSEDRERFERGLRNIDRVTVVPVAGVNVYDLVNSRHVVCVQDAVVALEARVGGA